MLSTAVQWWAAASRAVRSPTPLDVDVVEKLGGAVFLTGNAAFRPERVDAYETGFRLESSPVVSFSLSAFYNDYEHLRSVEAASSSAFLPLHWGNAIRGSTYGIEAWADLQVADWWRVSPGIRTLHENLRFAPGASGLLGVGQSGNDPSVQASLTSMMDLPHRLSFDTSLRRVTALPDPSLPGYYELSARLGWRVMQGLEIDCSGNNLLHSRHFEYPAPDAEAIPRSFMVGFRWRR